jgi:hypothetical protein
VLHKAITKKRKCPKNKKVIRKKNEIKDALRASPRVRNNKPPNLGFLAKMKNLLLQQFLIPPLNLSMLEKID